MTDDLLPSGTAPNFPYSDASVYVDADGSTVIARLRDSLRLEGGDQRLLVGPVHLSAGYNDYATGRRAHPYDFLEWPTVLECEAPSGAPADVVEAVAAVLESLWSLGVKAVAACDFEDELPECGGREKYPVPAPSEEPRGAVIGRWKGLFSRRNRKG
ncbi:hypothetical protein [Streptomyces sp. NPDC008121]|uniref:hypothetical protein n=1 Tax=Streptomyces sp. NPDC008121 TaxID=3364809 RepID=UPI0036E9F3D8